MTFLSGLGLFIFISPAFAVTEESYHEHLSSETEEFSKCTIASTAKGLSVSFPVPTATCKRYCKTIGDWSNATLLGSDHGLSGAHVVTLREFATLFTPRLVNDGTRDWCMCAVGGQDLAKFPALNRIGKYVKFFADDHVTSAANCKSSDPTEKAHAQIACFNTYRRAYFNEWKLVAGALRSTIDLNLISNNGYDANDHGCESCSGDACRDHILPNAFEFFSKGDKAERRPQEIMDTITQDVKGVKDTEVKKKKRPTDVDTVILPKVNDVVIDEPAEQPHIDVEPAELDVPTVPAVEEDLTPVELPDEEPADDDGPGAKMMKVLNACNSAEAKARAVGSPLAYELDLGDGFNFPFTDQTPLHKLTCCGSDSKYKMNAKMNLRGNDDNQIDVYYTGEEGNEKVAWMWVFNFASGSMDPVRTVLCEGIPLTQYGGGILTLPDPTLEASTAIAEEQVLKPRPAAPSKGPGAELVSKLTACKSAVTSSATKGGFTVNIENKYTFKLADDAKESKMDPYGKYKMNSKLNLQDPSTNNQVDVFFKEICVKEICDTKATWMSVLNYKQGMDPLETIICDGIKKGCDPYNYQYSECTFPE